ncbi:MULTISPECIES: hypothetical protein [Streptomyces]|uniref:hypothetical protein n=1 Tax=Streptomyces TaxID=1883 RepID=UPI000B2FE1B7
MSAERDSSSDAAPDEGEPESAPQEVADGLDDESVADLLDDPLGAGRPSQLWYAPGAVINTGSLRGGQHLYSHGAPGDPGTRHVESHEGPISPEELLNAGAGFVAPDCFPAGLAALDTRLLFLAGEPGTGRRTTALNLLRRHRGGSMALRAVDSDVDLSSWRPTPGEARGYLVDGIPARHTLKAGVINNLRHRLADAEARMVIILPDDPGLIRDLERDLHLSPVRCDPPPPRQVFDARLADTVPGPDERNRLLANLEPGLLDELLLPGLVPAQVAELVAVVAGTADGGADASDIRQRLSFLAEEEVPDLLKKLLDDRDGLAFLLASCVFEGLDHRTVREEAERLLELADGRLHAVRQGRDEGQGAGQEEKTRPNPEFVFRRSMDDLLRTVRAHCAPKEIRSGARFNYAVEPVRFTRQGQAEAVLKYVWREYGQLSGLLTDWLSKVRSESELTQPVGRVMGLAATWGGGRSALRHIRELAESDLATSRAIAAYALGMAAEDSVLAGEVKYRLGEWSQLQSWQLRWTVAQACGTDFGASRPDRALQLLRRLTRGSGEGHEIVVGSAVRRALLALFREGHQISVFRHLSAWVDDESVGADFSLRMLPALLHTDPAWFGEQLVSEDEFAVRIVDLVRRMLNDDELFDPTMNAVIFWCRMVAWDERQRPAVEILLTALAADMEHGVLRLFVEIDRHEDIRLAGKGIARQALDSWRNDTPLHDSIRQPWRTS